MRLRVSLVLLASLFVGCSGDDGGSGSGLPVVDVVLGQHPSALTIHAEVAATAEQRSLGLMNRTKLAADEGMLFLFRGPVRVGFYMKNTLIPLDIAFIAAGVVREIHSMEPCRADPCPVTRPGVSFEQALEVAAGTFAASGIIPGTGVAVKGTLPTPA